MTIVFKPVIQCDGCHVSWEGASWHIPEIITQLKEEGWVFNYGLYHDDYCDKCVKNGWLELSDKRRRKEFSSE